jgi:hypothetical protein
MRLSSGYCVLSAVSGLLLILIFLPAYYKAPNCTFVSILTDFIIRYASCVHVETYIRSSWLHNLS